MTTTELIKQLRDSLPKPVDYAEMVGASQWAYGQMYVFDDPLWYFIEEAADRLEQLQRFVDDMLGDHYVDYLDFYINRCRELEEELSRKE